MSALGQKQTSAHVRVMSALPQKADIADRDWHVRFVPKADSCTAANSKASDEPVGFTQAKGRTVATAVASAKRACAQQGVRLCAAATSVMIAI
jgi:hypothetical protein